MYYDINSKSTDNNNGIWIWNHLFLKCYFVLECETMEIFEEGIIPDHPDLTAVHCVDDKRLQFVSRIIIQVDIIIPFPNL